MGKALYKMLVIQAFRADRLLAMASMFVSTVLGESFQHAAEQELDLANIVNTEVRESIIDRIILYQLENYSSTLLEFW